LLASRILIEHRKTQLVLNILQLLTHFVSWELHYLLSISTLLSGLFLLPFGDPRGVVCSRG
jgi:hypothetical protein